MVNISLAIRTMPSKLCAAWWREAALVGLCTKWCMVYTIYKFQHCTTMTLTKAIQYLEKTISALIFLPASMLCGRHTQNCVRWEKALNETVRRPWRPGHGCSKGWDDLVPPIPISSTHLLCMVYIVVPLHRYKTPPLPSASKVLPQWWSWEIRLPWSLPCYNVASSPRPPQDGQVEHVDAADR